jgi:hypothetical protein
MQKKLFQFAPTEANLQWVKLPENLFAIRPRTRDFAVCIACHGVETTIKDSFAALLGFPTLMSVCRKRKISG